MRSLLEIQEEIKNLELTLKTMSNTIKSINDDIQSLREVGDESDLDYDRIRVMAKQVQFINHPLENVDDELVVQMYIKLLLCVVSLDQEAAMAKMSFIQWIMNTVDMADVIEDLFRECKKLDKKILNNAAELIPDDYKIYLIIDALITAKINGKANKESLDFIADLCIVLGIRKNTAEDCAVLSRIVLYQSTDGVESKGLKRLSSYHDNMKHYITKSLAEKISTPERELVVRVSDYEVSGGKYGFCWFNKQKGEVNKGDSIAGYEMKHPLNHKRIIAPISGTLYQFRDNNTNFGVISTADDDKDDIKQWVKTKLQNGGITNYGKAEYYNR